MLGIVPTNQVFTTEDDVGFRTQWHKVGQGSQISPYLPGRIVSGGTADASTRMRAGPT